ncbi:MAG: diphthine synthase [Sulfolobaceae archaeon]|nr:diphthine synthase [Sulfolobaceae archaeon]
MSKLLLVGLGLSSRHITNSVIETLRNVDIVMFDTYTSISCDIDAKYISKLIGKDVIEANRNLLENESRKVIELLNQGKSIAILTIGDPMIATTHVSLALQAKSVGHSVDIVPGISVYCYFISKSMLSAYKFGKSSTIVKPIDDYIDPGSYYTLEENRARGLHTLFFLEPGLTASSGLEVLMKLEDKIKHNVISRNDIAIVGERLGCNDEKVFAATIDTIINLNLQNLPHILIIPSKKLHYIEEEALKWLMITK